MQMVTPGDRLGMTLFFAIVAHIIVILGVVFVPSEKHDARYRTLDIVLVQRRSEKAPEKTDFLAQANQEGGGDASEKARPATPLPTPFTGPEPIVAAASPPSELSGAATEPPSVRPRPQPAEEQPTPKPIIAVAASETPTVPEPSRSTPKPKEKPHPEPQPSPQSTPAPQPTITATSLVTRSLALASLSAEIDQRLQAYAERPRRKWINARTREYKYASYMEAWRAKVERIGNLNYPDEARRRKLSGDLLLEVVINVNGSINDIVLRRSSGHRVLDDAAIRIVKLAAPFAPLPRGILEETDLLHIERTWRFLSSQQFAG